MPRIYIYNYSISTNPPLSQEAYACVQANYIITYHYTEGYPNVFVAVIYSARESLWDLHKWGLNI